jgi:hypothetical protein
VVLVEEMLHLWQSTACQSEAYVESERRLSDCKNVFTTEQKRLQRNIAPHAVNRQCPAFRRFLTQREMAA